MMKNEISDRKMFQVKVNYVSSFPLFKQIKQLIKNEIVQCSLPLGVKLPSAKVLNRQGVASVVTIERAYWELEKEGIVKRIKGSGYFVAQSNDNKRLTATILLNRLSEYEPSVYETLIDTFGNALLVNVRNYDGNVDLLQHLIREVKLNSNYLVINNRISDLNLSGFELVEQGFVLDFSMFQVGRSGLVLSGT